MYQHPQLKPITKTWRGISPETFAKYGVGLDNKNNVVMPYTVDGVIVGAKVRNPSEKDFWYLGESSDVQLFGMQAANGDRRLIICEGECLLPDAQVLTRRGWVTIADFEFEDVYQVHADGTGSFVQPIAKVWKSHQGDVVTVSNRNLSYTTTAGHNHVSRDKHGKLTKHLATNRPPSNHSVPLVAPYLGGVGLPYSDDELRFAIALSADAKLDQRVNGSVYAHFGFTKQRKVDRLKQLCDAIGWECTVTPSSEYTYFSGNLKRYSNFGRLLPYTWLSDATQHQLRVLLSELAHWDGNTVPNRNQVEYATKYLHNAEWVQTLARLLGFAGSIIQRSNEHGEWYKVSILFDKDSFSWQSSTKVTTSQYSGMVGCVTVPSGMLLVRFGQTVVVTGNCDALAANQMTGYAAVSIPFGAEAAEKHIKKSLRWIEKFDDVVVCFDSDEPGQRSQAAVMKLLKPGKARAMTLPLGFKDANDMLKAGKADEFKTAYFAAQSVLPRGIVGKQELIDRTVAFLGDKARRRGFSTGYDGLDDLLGGWREGEVHTIAAGTGVGKAHPVSSLIVLQDGRLRRLGDVQVGDVLANGVVVEAKSPVWEKRPIIRVHFDDGTWYDCDENHLWQVSSQKRRDLDDVVLPAKQMMKDYLYPDGRKRYGVALVETEYPTQQQPIDPYLFGVWLGDGTYASGNITLHDADAHILEPYGARKLRTCQRWAVPGLHKTLVVNGFAPKVPSSKQMKHIPRIYQHADKEQRMELLRGLLDTDGTVERGTATFCNTNKALSWGVLELARSLGFKARLKTKRATLYGKDCGECFTVYIQTTQPVTLFKLERKQELLNTQQKCTDRKFITKMERVGRQDTQCIQVTGGLYQLVGHTITHNSSVTRNLCYRAAKQKHKSLYIPLEDLTEVAASLFAEMDMGEMLIKSNEPLDEERIRASLDVLLDSVSVFDQKGAMTVDDLVTAIEYVVREEDVKFVVLDHITAMANSIPGAEERKALDMCIEALKLRVAVPLKCTVVVVSHLNRNSSDAEDNDPNLARIKGSSSIAQYSDTVLAVTRDRDSKTMTVKTIKANRVWGVWGAFDLIWDSGTQQLEENKNVFEALDDAAIETSYSQENNEDKESVRETPTETTEAEEGTTEVPQSIRAKRMEPERVGETGDGVRDADTTLPDRVNIHAGSDTTERPDRGTEGTVHGGRQTKNASRKRAASRQGVRLELPKT